jgi:hypothetical protein
MAPPKPTLSPARALRVGVLLGGNLVEERLFRVTPELTGITVGQSLRCTLSLPVEGVPAVHLLFAREGDRFVLRTTAAMTGRLARRGELRELPPSPSTLPIEPGTRGRLCLGDATLLFQELAAPPLAPRPQLPASVRGSLVERVDRRLAITMGASLLGHVGLATWAWLTEPEPRPTLVPDELAIYEPPRYDVVELTLPDDFAPPSLPDDTGPPAPLPPPLPAIAQPANPARQTPRPIVDRLPEADDPDRWAQVVTGNTPGTTGQHEIASRQPGVALETQIADIRDRDREVRVGNAPITREAPVRPGTTPTGPIIDGPRLESRPKISHEPSVRITPLPRPPQPDAPTLTPAMVVARIVNQYMAGLERCYKHGLASDPDLSAKVTLRFGVDETGGTFDSHAGGANAGVDRCVQDQMSRWRFPVPKDRDGDPTDAHFQIQLVLRPS